MPNVFLQAWARGVPTVSSVDVGAPVNTVFSDVDQGAREVERLLADDVLWHRASAASLSYFERNHSSAEVLARYVRLFEQLVR
jgi:glycosyltransferase involved in cell wall biosynthesis